MLNFHEACIDNQEPEGLGNAHWKEGKGFFGITKEADPK